MGCGRSKLQSIYPRKASSKNNDTREGGEECVAENGDSVAAAAAATAAGAEDGADARAAQVTKSRLLGGTSQLLAMAEISSSQLDFFKMLDEKIANGPDYDSADDQSRTTSPSHSSPRPSCTTPLPQNGHSKPHGALKFTSTHHVPQSSPTRARTPTKSPARLPTLQASPPPHEPNKKVSVKPSFGAPMKTAYSMKHRPTS